MWCGIANLICFRASLLSSNIKCIYTRIVTRFFKHWRVNFKQKPDVLIWQSSMITNSEKYLCNVVLEV
jgi:hypothetical protein